MIHYKKLSIFLIIVFGGYFTKQSIAIDMPFAATTQTPAPIDAITPVQITAPTDQIAQVQVLPPAITNEPINSVPVQSTAPVIPIEQFKWPDAVEIGESDENIVNTTKQPALIALINESAEIIKAIENLAQDLTNKRNTLYDQYFEQNKKIDQFLQEISFQAGSSNQLITNEELPKSKESL